MEPKYIGSFKMILNLKKINVCVETPFFKIESVKNFLFMIEPEAWMASADLKDAFFTIPITLIIESFLNSYIKESHMNLIA